MRLDLNRPVPAQIQEAKDRGQTFYFNLAKEAAGDKAASTAVIQWLLDRFDLPEITVTETVPGRTSFMLADYLDNRRIRFATIDPCDEPPGLDLHTTGQSLAALWELNPWLAMKGIRPKLNMETKEGSQFVFAIRVDAEYDQRKNMDLLCARKTIDALKEHAEVVVLLEREDPMFLDAPQLTMKECVQHIASSRMFFGGDSGFSHIAAALGKKQVAIYPDYARAGKGSLIKVRAIQDWWEIDDLHYVNWNPLPNAAAMKAVTLGTDHRWSIADVVNAAMRLEQYIAA